MTDSEAQADRTADRLSKVSAGLSDLDLWMRDIVRGGLASLPEQPQKFWRDMAARLVDAQAPGLARMVNELSGLPASGEGWQERLLERLSKLHLLIESFKRLDTLPAVTQADVRALIGWTQTKADVADEVGVQDDWLVLGKRVTVDETNLKLQRTWLWGDKSNRPALLMDYAVSGQSFETNLIPGLTLPATLLFFPSNYPLRALGRDSGVASPIKNLSGHSTIDSVMRAYSQALSCNPWLDLFPILISNVIPIQTDSGWLLRDNTTHYLPIASRFVKGRNLLALSGGHSLTIFGEWDGEVLLPLGAWAEGKFVSLA